MHACMHGRQELRSEQLLNDVAVNVHRRRVLGIGHGRPLEGGSCNFERQSTTLQYSPGLPPSHDGQAGDDSKPFSYRHIN